MLATFGVGFGCGLIILGCLAVSLSLGLVVGGVIVAGASLLFVDFDRKAQQ